MRHLYRILTLAAVGGFVAMGGITANPSTAEAGRIGRSFVKSVAVGSAARSVSRAAHARGSEEEKAETRKVDFEARAREARAKLAAESSGAASAVVPVSAAAVVPVEERKAVCVAGCY